MLKNHAYTIVDPNTSQHRKLWFFAVAKGCNIDLIWIALWASNNMISLSKPRPKPLWGTEPKRRRSRYLAANWPTGSWETEPCVLCATVFCPELRSTTSSLLALSPSQWSACQGHPTSSQHLLKLTVTPIFKKKLANVFPDTNPRFPISSLSSRWEPPMTWKKLHIQWDPVMLGFFHLPTSPMAGASTSMAATVLLSFAKPAQLQGFKNLDIYI